VSATLAAARFPAALPFAAYVREAGKNAELWQGLYRTATIRDEDVARARSLGGPWRLLALSEDWCGDTVNTLPIIARLAEQAGNLELRMLRRDEHDDLMHLHLSSGTRSIPVVMILDAEGWEWGWWGPRPAGLQRWVRAVGMLLPREERYRRTRSWYARDRGRTTIEEILVAIGRAGRRRAAARAET
jgi:hypothetical protein